MNYLNAENLIRRGRAIDPISLGIVAAIIMVLGAVVVKVLEG